MFFGLKHKKFCNWTSECYFKYVIQIFGVEWMCQSIPAPPCVVVVFQETCNLSPIWRRQHIISSNIISGPASYYFLKASFVFYEFWLSGAAQRVERRIPLLARRVAQGGRAGPICQLSDRKNHIWDNRDCALDGHPQPCQLEAFSAGGSALFMLRASAARFRMPGRGVCLPLGTLMRAYLGRSRFSRLCHAGHGIFIFV